MNLFTRIRLFFRCLILAHQEIELLRQENQRLRLLAAEQLFIDQAAAKWKARIDSFGGR